jgi:hypothetical protein
MRLGSSGWGFLAVTLGLATPIAARAQEVEGGGRDRLSPARLIEGPSLGETGRVGAMTPASAGVPGGKELTVQPEKDVAPAAQGLGAEPQRPKGTVDEARLAREIDTYLTSLDDCRINAARVKQVLPSGVAADKLVLRWTILPDGRTGMTSVVAASPTDAEVMNCVKAAMARWTFTAPRGGSLPVERSFAFRTLPQQP